MDKAISLYKKKNKIIIFANPTQLEDNGSLGARIASEPFTILSGSEEEAKIIEIILKTLDTMPEVIRISEPYSERKKKFLKSIKESSYKKLYDYPCKLSIVEEEGMLIFSIWEKSNEHVGLVPRDKNFEVKKNDEEAIEKIFKQILLVCEK